MWMEMNIGIGLFVALINKKPDWASDRIKQVDKKYNKTPILKIGKIVSLKIKFNS